MAYQVVYDCTPPHPLPSHTTGGSAGAHPMVESILLITTHVLLSGRSQQGVCLSVAGSQRLVSLPNIEAPQCVVGSVFGKVVAQTSIHTSCCYVSTTDLVTRVCSYYEALTLLPPPPPLSHPPHWLKGTVQTARQEDTHLSRGLIVHMGGTHPSHESPAHKLDIPLSHVPAAHRVRPHKNNSPRSPPHLSPHNWREETEARTDRPRSSSHATPIGRLSLAIKCT